MACLEWQHVDIVMAFIVMAFVVVTYIVMAYIVMACLEWQQLLVERLVLFTLVRHNRPHLACVHACACACVRVPVRANGRARDGWIDKRTDAQGTDMPRMLPLQ